MSEVKQHPVSFSQRAAAGQSSQPVTQSFKARKVHTKSVRDVELERQQALEDHADREAHPVRPLAWAIRVYGTHPLLRGHGSDWQVGLCNDAHYICTVQYDVLSNLMWPLWVSLDFVVQPLECGSPQKVMEVHEHKQERSFSQRFGQKHSSSLSCVQEDQEGQEEGHE